MTTPRAPLTAEQVDEIAHAIAFRGEVKGNLNKLTFEFERLRAELTRERQRREQAEATLATLRALRPDLERVFDDGLSESPYRMCRKVLALLDEQRET
jgi:hypothetical protein